MTPTHKIWTELSKHLSRQDHRMRPLIRQIGPPAITLQSAPFRALVESILSQQLAPKASQSIIDRVTALSPPFPTPVALCSISSQRLRGAGVSSQKMSYLRSLCDQWSDRAWRRGWAQCSDEALIERLIKVKGIGEWTAHMFLIFSLGRPNVLPTGDYGVRRGVQLLFDLKEMPGPKQLPALVSHWTGAYSIGSWYLWQALDRKLLA